MPLAKSSQFTFLSAAIRAVLVTTITAMKTRLIFIFWMNFVCLSLDLVSRKMEIDTSLRHFTLILKIDSHFLPSKFSFGFESLEFRWKNELQWKFHQNATASLHCRAQRCGCSVLWLVLSRNVSSNTAALSDHLRKYYSLNWRRSRIFHKKQSSPLKRHSRETQKKFRRQNKNKHSMWPKDELLLFLRNFKVAKSFRSQFAIEFE